MEKLAAHQPPGVLHLAFSVFLVDDGGRVLLQRRSTTKHHFRGRWSNSCCSHPRPGESVVAAATRRVDEELGLVVDLHDIGSFSYRAVDPESGLVEHELDHVLVGPYDGSPLRPDGREIDALGWAHVTDMRHALALHPHRFTPWLAPALDVVEAVASR